MRFKTGLDAGRDDAQPDADPAYGTDVDQRLRAAVAQVEVAASSPFQPRLAMGADGELGTRRQATVLMQQPAQRDVCRTIALGIRREHEPRRLITLTGR